MKNGVKNGLENGPKCSLIVATGLDGAIGKNGTMPWHLPEDLKHFKETTFGHPILMGRKTFESLGRTLKGRKHIVVTRQSPEILEDFLKTFPNPSQEEICLAPSLEEARKLLSADSATLFVIGGAEIYRQILDGDQVEVIHRTLIHKTYPDADTFFPALDMTRWIVQNQTEVMRSSSGLEFQYQTLMRQRLKTLSASSQTHNETRKDLQ